MNENFDASFAEPALTRSKHADHLAGLGSHRYGGERRLLHSRSTSPAAGAAAPLPRKARANNFRSIAILSASRWR